MLLLVALALGGTFILRKKNSDVAVGFFFGLCAMMANVQFVIFAVFAGLGNDADKQSEKDSNRAVAAFSFFQFILYTIFTFILYFNKEELLQQEPSYVT